MQMIKNKIKNKMAKAHLKQNIDKTCNNIRNCKMTTTPPPAQPHNISQICLQEAIFESI
jgi:hypothetical protein